MNKVNWHYVAKGVGLLGAILTGAAMCLTGDLVGGGGIIFAAFASAPSALKEI